MSPALELTDLGHRYGSIWALRHCAAAVPEGSVAALVGPNGAGKSTLLALAVGLLDPSEGEVLVLGRPMRGQPDHMLARVGFVAQDAPLYRGFSVAEMLDFGARLNPRWDDTVARRRLTHLNIPFRQKCGRLSGGQQAQVALAIAVSKHPDVLLLDEPLARLDPLARREFLEALMEAVAESGVTVILSSHLIADLERICDHLIVLVNGTIVLAGDTDALLADHQVVSGFREPVSAALRHRQVIEHRSTERQLTAIVRGDGIMPDPRVEARPVGLEELVLAYLRMPRDTGGALQLAEVTCS